MAVRGPFKRWRFAEPVRDIEDIKKSLRDLEVSYEEIIQTLEQGVDDAPGTGDAPGDAEYLTRIDEQTDLPASSILTAGSNVSLGFATGPPRQLFINVPSATGTTRGVMRLAGDLGTGTADDPRVVGVQSNPFQSGTPQDGALYRWSGSQFVFWSPKYITATLSANQSSNLAAGDHVEFDTVDFGSGITLSTGAGQASGIFTFPAGTYVAEASTRASFTDGAGNVQLQWAINGGGTISGNRSLLRPPSSGSNLSSNATSRFIASFASSMDIELRIFSPTNLTSVLSVGTNATIHAIA